MDFLSDIFIVRCIAVHRYKTVSCVVYCCKGYFLCYEVISRNEFVKRTGMADYFLVTRVEVHSIVLESTLNLLLSSIRTFVLRLIFNVIG